LLDIDNGSTEWQVRVIALSDQRGPAPVAQALYAETEDGVRQREQRAEQRKVFSEPGEAIRGRPTKRDRRMIDRSRG
jgi:ribosome-associated heat shock protein Hsp15